MKLLLRHKPKQNLRMILETLYQCKNGKLWCRECLYRNEKCTIMNDALDYLLSYKDIESQLPDTYYWRYKCTNCGKEVDSSFDFCPKCGSQLNWEYTNDEK